MKSNERQAIIDYLEFSLVKYVQGIEKHVTPDVTNLMYEEADKLLADVEETLKSQAQLDHPPQKAQI